ncbi:MAG: PhnB protein [Bacteroidia bacterium]|jgi:PhnB protein
MGSDSSQAYGQATTIGNNVTMSVHSNTEEETDCLFTELDKDGTITMALNHTFWGSYFGMLTDQFGIH